jgi:hypothetical protein
VEILGGIKAGERIAASARGLKDGQLVREP